MLTHRSGKTWFFTSKKFTKHINCEIQNKDREATNQEGAIAEETVNPGIKKIDFFCWFKGVE